MGTPLDAVLLRIFVGEEDRYHGQLLYEEIVAKALERGITMRAASEAGWSHYRIDDGGSPMQLPYRDKLPTYIGPPGSRSGRPQPANSQIIAGHQSVIPVVRPRTLMPSRRRLDDPGLYRSRRHFRPKTRKIAVPVALARREPPPARACGSWRPSRLARKNHQSCRLPPRPCGRG
jgi:hypothetical protein